MQFIYDNLVAVLLAGTVIFALVASQRDATGLSAEQTSLYAGRSQMEGFATWLQRDLTRAGENLRTGESRFDMPTQLTSGNTSLFQFSRDSLRRTVDGATDTLRVFVRYQLQTTTDSATVGRNAQGRAIRVPLFGVTRQEQLRTVVNRVATPTTNGWVAAGGAPRGLTYFRIEPTRRGDLSAANQNEAEYLRAQFSLVPPYNVRDRYLDELHWGTTVGLRPF